jgi:hypothetical protein
MPQMGYDTKTDRLTDRQLQCDFDFDLSYYMWYLHGLCKMMF